MGEMVGVWLVGCGLKIVDDCSKSCCCEIVADCIGSGVDVGGVAFEILAFGFR